MFADTMKLFCFILLFFCSSIGFSQNKRIYPDTTKKIYYSIVLDYPSTRGFPSLIGIERCQKINNYISFTSSLNTFVWPIQHVGSPPPLFIVFCFQPFHLLVGKKQLKIETGLSVTYFNSNVNNSPRSNRIGYAGTSYTYNIYLGFRYNFKKIPFHLHAAYVPYFEPTLHKNTIDYPLFEPIGFEFGIGYIFHKFKH